MNYLSSVCHRSDYVQLMSCKVKETGHTTYKTLHLLI